MSSEIALTTVGRVKEFLGDKSSEFDTLYLETVDGVSERMQEYISARIAAHDVVGEVVESAGFSAIVVDEGPIIKVEKVVEGATEIDATGYRVDARARRIVRVSGSTDVAWARGKVTVDYRAGFEVDDLPHSLRQAATVQCAYEMRQTQGLGNRIGLTGDSTPDGGSSYDLTDDGWIASVRETLDLWRRRRL